MDSLHKSAKYFLRNLNVECDGPSYLQSVLKDKITSSHQRCLEKVYAYIMLSDRWRL